MKTVLNFSTSFLVAMLAMAVGLNAADKTEPGNAAKFARELIETAGLQGGLIVQLGCGEGKLTAALHTKDSFIIHALDAAPENVAAARQHLHSVGLSGPVSVEHFDDTRLPYVDNLVNLVVKSEDFQVTSNEIMRVLAPGGMALTVNTKSQLLKEKSLKQRPTDIDEWSHYLHDPEGNPVAQDQQVRPPRQFQWIGDPAWARHHDHMASMSALVSSGGKLFHICDEGSKVSMLQAPEWRLTARDAFNGLVLWQRPLQDWFSHLQPLKSGPASLPRRLVADNSQVYVTLGIDAPVSALAASTGRTLRVYGGTEDTQEIILSEGRLFLVRGTASGSFLTAVDAVSGALLWNKQQNVITLTLAANPDKVVCFDGSKVMALNRDTGAPLWSSPELPERSRASWIAAKTPRLILDKKAVVLSLDKSVYVLSSDHGRLLWSAPQPVSGYVSPKDLFVIGGLVWYGDTAGGKSSGRFEGRDLMTGEVKRGFLPDKDLVWLSHHRCHFSKATCNYILPARMGVEFVDLNREQWTPNHWLRGGCIYGIMPCNGLLYAPPHACACYLETKVNGFSALSSTSQEGAPIPEGKRLEKGPAYAQAASAGPGVASTEDWPTFRQNSARSGTSRTSVDANLTNRWQVRLGGELTQPVVAEGRVFVSAKAKHTLYALDMDTGKPLWNYTVGSRVDSPPTIYKGLVLFGCRDGWIYSLRAQDGALVWRYRAYPHESLILAYSRLESAWPVSGSILIENEELHCVAGRNMFLDGGLVYLRLDPTTGRKISETIMDQTDPLLGGSIQKYDSWLDMTTTLPDVLSSDGTNIYMRSLPFDLQGHRRRITHIAEETEAPHLFSPTGFLDDSWFHRSYWTYGRTFPGGWIGHLNAGRYNPSGRLLVTDGATIFGFGRQPEYYQWTTSLEYRLFAVDKAVHRTQDIYASDPFKVAQQEKFPKMKIDRQLGLPSGPRAAGMKSYFYKWENRKLPVLVRAMVATKDALFVGGPNDVVEEGTLFHRDAKDGVREKEKALAKQAALWQGKGGATLLAISKVDGQKLAEYHLEALPVFDGMIAACNRLFIADETGTLVCLGSLKSENVGDRK